MENFKTPIFDSKIKFYFSLLFMSIDDFEILTKNFGESVEVFEHASFSLEENEIPNLNRIFTNIKNNNEKIELLDKTILNLFSPDEVKNYYNVYCNKNPFFNVSDPDDLEKFYNYMLLEKVREKKQTEYGTIYDLFDTFSDEEILNGVANLDYLDKKVFIELFGIKGDITFEINSNDSVQNEILIKLYDYMLSKREEADIPTIIRNIEVKGDYEYSFYDYIRMICNDKSLSNEFILEMLSKMDYNSKKCIKDVFGQSLEKKTKPSKEKEFKKVIHNLSIIVKVNKEYRKRKRASFDQVHKKKVGLEDKEKKLKEDKGKKEKKQDFKIIVENKPLKEEKIKEPEKKEDKKQNKKEKPKKEQKKEENKNIRLKSFLQKEGINKKDFEKAIELLDPVSKKAVILYYGINKEPQDLKAIAEKLGETKEEVSVILEKAEKKIVSLIKTGAINQVKEDKKNDKPKENAYGKLINYANKNNISFEDLMKETVVLASMEKMVMDVYLRENMDSPLKIAETLNIKKEEAERLIDSATDKIISSLSQKEKEKNEETKEETKEEIVKVVENKTEESKIKNEPKKLGSLDVFLKKNGITKKEFFELYKTLDPFSKTVLNLYLGLYAASMTVFEIAKKYNRTVSEIENIIASCESKFNKTVIKENKLNLNVLLNKYGISRNAFISELENLPINQRYMIMDYFGIRSASMSFEDLIKKYGKKPDELNKMVEKIIVGMARDKKKENKNKEIPDKLNKFLTVNKIAKDQFLNSLELLSLEEKKLVSMYFGLNGSEMSIIQIALLTKQKPMDVKNNLSGILRKVNSICKSGNNLDASALENSYKVMKLKISSLYQILMQDAGFLLYVSSNPVVANILSVVTNFNFDLDKAAKMLMMSKQDLMSNLVKVSNVCETYASGMSKNLNKNGFYDEETKEKEVGRKY